MSESTQKQTVQRLRIWNDPESRIAFLETTLGSKDWEAVIYEPPKGSGIADKPQHSLEEIQKELRKKDYSTQLGTDDEGNRTLTIKHFGQERGFITNIQELGLVKGWHRTWDHLPDTLSTGVKQAKEFGHYVVEDKARILSGLYLAGDAMMMFASMVDKSGHGAKEAANAVKETFKERMSKPENYLHSIAAMHALGQSIFLMKFAKDGSEIRLDELRDHMDEALMHGTAPSDVLKYKGDEAKNEDNFVVKFAKRHPLEVASAMQISGGAFNILSARAQLANNTPRSPEEIKNIQWGMAGSAASMAGWAMLMAPTKSEPDENGNKPNIFERNQEEFASGAQFIANGLRMWGARGVKTESGEREGGNPWTMASESTFMLGDLTMMALNAKEYGAHGAANPDMTARAASTFIASMPMVLGQEEEQKFIGDLSNYLARQMIEEQMSSEEGRAKAAGKNEDEMTAELATKIGKATRKELMGKERKLGVIVNAAANIAHTFPDAEQNNVIDALSDKISGLTGVYIEKEKLKQLIDAEERTLVMMDAGGGNVVKERPKMPDIAKYVSSIVSSLPPLNAAENASYVYDALVPMIETSPRDAMHMEKAMKDSMKERSVVPSHVLAVTQQRAAAQVSSPSYVQK